MVEATINAISEAFSSLADHYIRHAQVQINYLLIERL